MKKVLYFLQNKAQIYRDKKLVGIARVFKSNNKKS